VATTVQNLLEAGVHFGHQTKRWNPKMKPYIFGAKNGIHIFDLGKTMYCLNEACKFIYKEVANGGDVLFVGTKRQAQELVKEAAQRDNMHYVTFRWLGGTLTNLETIRKSITKFSKLKKMEEDGSLDKMKKKESSRLRREMGKLDRQLCGIMTMKKAPSVMVILDIAKEHIAVNEANILGIPVVAIIDSNVDPDLVSYGIPGNDDAVRSLKVIVDQLSTAIHAGKGIADKKAAEAKAKEEARRESEKKEREDKAKALAKQIEEAQDLEEEAKIQKATSKKKPVAKKDEVLTEEPEEKPAKAPVAKKKTSPKKAATKAAKKAAPKDAK
jgi:small subunit ribosomal protein S2